MLHDGTDLSCEFSETAIIMELQIHDNSYT